jgi:hypothetical protein
VRDIIIHISTQSSSNEIQGIVVVFIPYELTLGRVVDRSQNHIHRLYDLPNGTTLAQEIIVSLIFLVTKILAIKDNKIDNTFIHVAFRS